MKTLVILVAFLGATLTVQAQQYSATKDTDNSDDTNHHYSSTVRPSPATQSKPGQPEKLQPKETGVIYEMSEQGFVVIDPSAPVEMGLGQHYMAKNPFPGTTAPDNANESKREFGGYKLYGWDF